MRRALLVLVLLGPLLLAGSARAGAWVWPLTGPTQVVRDFDPPASAYGAGHRGVDLRGTAGQIVRSAGAGRVTFAGVLAGRGVVTIAHAAGLRTTYEPVTAAVTVGQAVAAGGPLGTLVGGHCRDGGACLHWGLLRGPRYLNPLSLLQATAFRLLPVDRQPARSGVAAPGIAVTRPIARAPGATRLPTAAPAPPAPHLVLRAADRTLGVAALLLLAMGLAMIVRRPAPPPRARPPEAAAPTARIVDSLPVAAAPVDLEQERARRRG